MNENGECNDNEAWKAQLADNQRQLKEQAAERFSQAVADLFMAVEELRQILPAVTGENDATSARAILPIDVEALLQWQRHVDRLLQILRHMARFAEDASAAAQANDTTIAVMHQHAVVKAVSISQHALTLSCTQYAEPVEEDEPPNDNARVLNYHAGAPSVPIDEQRRNGQGAVARLTEVNLILCCILRDVSETSKDPAGGGGGDDHGDIMSMGDIVDMYVQYQRLVLRLRAKPAIAQLVLERRKGTFDRRTDSNGSIPSTIVPGAKIIVTNHNDDDDDDYDETCTKPLDVQAQQHHAPVLTLILGETASLIHPLASWMAHLQPQSPIDNTANEGASSLDAALRQICTDSIRTLDDQAQSLAKTVSDWFWQDRPVDAWIQQSSLSDEGEYHAEPSSPLLADLHGENGDLALARLDALVEEMAYSSQVFERYRTLLAGTSVTGSVIITRELLPEWTVKYGALERFLALQQWQAALKQAVPVTIVMGTEIRVPSVVEDAQYLSTRALERAASTRSLQAVATVAYAICHDIWSTEIDDSVSTEALSTHRSSSRSPAVAAAVYQALLDEMGCWSEEEAISGVQEKKRNVTVQSPQSGGFAAALLDALDDDIATEKTQSPKKKAPSSGNFLSSLVGDQEKIQQRQLDTLYCLLNGMHAVSGASRALVVFLDDLLLENADVAVTSETRKATSIIQLAREELSRHSDTYRKLLADRIDESLVVWCGDASSTRSKKNSLCFYQLSQYFENESYQLDGNSIVPAESEERLENALIGPLRISKFLKQLPDKCESEVLQITAERVALIVVDIVLNSLWKTTDTGERVKKFTDWGSLLLSTQSRLLQAFISTTMLQPSVLRIGGSTAPAAVGAKLLQVWERLSQVVAILQLEKPSDWLAYQTTSQLSAQELAQTMALRVDFSVDAIESIVTTVASSSGK